LREYNANFYFMTFWPKSGVESAIDSDNSINSCQKKAAREVLLWKGNWSNGPTIF
jgi:hypothetical protein